MTTPNEELMRLADDYSDCAIRVATGQTNRLETIAVEARATLVNALQSQAERIAELEAELAEITATEPVAFMWQHEETGRVGFIDPWQVENGWQKGNPRLKIIKPLFTRPMPAQDVNAELADCLSELCDIVDGVVEDKSSVGSLIDSFTTQPARTTLTKAAQVIGLTEKMEREPLTDEQQEGLIEDLQSWSRYVQEDTAHQSLEKHVREVLLNYGITKKGQQ